MKGGKDALLQIGVEVNEQIAATNQIEAGEGRIGQKIVLCEDDVLAQRLADPKAAGLFDEKAAEPLGRDILDETAGIKALAGFIEQRLV